eukprot:COSAG05_NODE_3061_length_2368_cov_6.177171_1_plen_102_part_00
MVASLQLWLSASFCTSATGSDSSSSSSMLQTASDGAVTARIEPGKRCITARDCAMNGRCVEGECSCSPAWSGAEDCSALSFTPAERASGYVRIPAPELTAR